MTAPERAAPEGPERFDLVIGVGHPDRGDDGVGPFVAEQVRGAGGAAAVIHGDCLSLLTLWADAGRVALVDAAQLGAPPGTVRRFAIGEDALPAGAFGSASHLLGPAAAIGLAETLGRLPPVLVIFAIQAAGTALGAGLSAPVRTAAEQLAASLSQSTEPPSPRLSLAERGAGPARRTSP